MSHDALDGFLDALADRLAERLARHDATRISQSDPRGLGPRRHREAVKRRMRDHQGGAFKIGRDYLLTPEALREELEQFGPRGVDPEVLRPAVVRRCSGKAAATAAESAEVAALRLKLDAELGAASRDSRRKGR